MRRVLFMAAAAAAVVLAAAGIAFAEPTPQDEIKDNGIPVMVVTIDENAEGYGTIDEMHQSPEHTAECTGVVDIQVPEGFRTDYTDASFTDMNGLQLDYIRGRGNSTWAISIKKPYKIRFTEEKDLFGMGASEHWVLLANLFERTKVRNRFTYWLGREMGLEFTPHGVPVDLYFKTADGSRSEYMGTYYLCEQVRVEKNRVDIDELKKEDIAGQNVTGGYLLSFERFEEELDGYRTDRDVTFYFENPKLTNQNAGRIAQREYIEGFLQDTEDAIFAEDFDHDAVAARMDLQSAADYWWIQEFSNNGDAFCTSSTYMYKKRDTDEGTEKLYWGPLWDFDLAWLVGAETNFDSSKMEWLDQLRKVDPEFRELLEERWEVLDGILQEATGEDGILNKYREELRDSWQADYDKYGNYSENWEEPDDWDGTYDSEYDDLINLIDVRRDYVNSHLEYIISGICKVDFMVDGQLLESITDCPIGSILVETPDAPEKDGYIFAGWYTEDGEEIDTYTLEEDTVFYAKYVLESEASQATQLFFRTCDVWTGLGEGAYEAEYQLLPADAEDKRISWTTSDESVATVDEKGRVTPVAVGFADITGTLTSGVENTFRIHIYDEEDPPEPVEGEAVCDTPELTVAQGESVQLRWHTEPRDELNSLVMNWVFYASDDDDTASVDDFGVIFGMKPGTTKVSVEIVQESDEPVTLECNVTVVGKDEPQAPVSISNAAVTLAAADYTYNGKVIKPAVRTIGGKTLTAGQDYTVTYSAASPKDVGQYTVNVTGKGKYTGSAKATYRINPKGTKIKKIKRGKKLLKIKWKRQKSKMSKKRVTGYQIQIATDKNFKSVVRTVNIKGWKKNTRRIKSLKRKTTYYARVRAYEKVGGITCYSTWSKVKKAKTR